MKRKISISALLVCFTFIAFAALADLTGNWVSSLKMQDGSEIALNYTFKVEGDKLTGAVGSPQGDLPISNGKVNGNDFSFSLDVNGMSIVNAGKYYGDSAVITIDFQGNKMQSVLKRSK